MLKGFLLPNVGVVLSAVVVTMRVGGAVFLIMIVIETTLLRYFMEFVWKRVPAINDAFVVTFLTFLNLLMGFLVSMARHTTGEGYDVLYRLRGIDSSLVPNPELELK